MTRCWCKLLFNLLVLFSLSLPAFAVGQAKESVYDHVIRTGTIHCGYFLWPPFLEKDVNTSKMSGLSYDIMEEIGKQMSLKIDWTEEVNFASMFEGFTNGRYDMICGPMSPTPARARASDFTITLFYTAYDLYVGANDTRFDKDRAALNDPAHKFAGLDGEFTAIIAQEDYPRATYISVPQLSDASQLLMTLATHKADATVTDPMTADKFIAQNPGKIRRLPGPPARVLAVAFSIPPGEERFKTMLNLASQSLLDSGFVERVLKKYPKADSTLLRIAKPYVERQ
jgi:ABC-type amino acid transport substrate-binding protein